LVAFFKSNREKQRNKNMWNVEDFDIKKNSINGEWLQLVNPKTGEDLVIEVDGKEVKSRVKMLGVKSKEGIKAKADAERSYREHEAKLKRLEKANKSYLPTDEEIESSERKDIEYCKAMVIDWEGMPDGKGGAAKFSEKEKDRIFAVDGIRSQLITFSLNALNFIKS